MSIHKSRRLAAIASVGALAAIAVLGAANPAFASKPVDGDHRVAYCHATHSEKNPFVYIETDKVAVVRAHYKHQDVEDAIPSFWYVWDGELLFFPGQNEHVLGEGDCDGSDPQ